ncbi:hypothetical protein E3N88_28223 [Mikania micrantha]|uniref:RPW8 domain-containing protein n=1 Tax=Mikania micrantha TaxID=192012 RepID=A0A5N6N1V7_9ASTR|nr:hypothetical protein E3N88_28223 [Mikania micrantha]
MGDPLLSESITRLTDIVIHVAKTTANFKPQLSQLQNTLQLIASIIDDVVKLNQILDRSKQESAMFIDEIQDAEKLVEKCLKIKRNFIKKYTHSLKLKDANNKLLRFFQLEVQADQSRDIKKTLAEVSDLKSRIDSLSVDARQIHQTWSYNSLSVSSRYELIERGNLGWRVPLLPRGIVAFDEPLKKLKAKVFEDSDAYDDGSNGDSNSMEIDDDGDESSVVVVAAAGGCGKTTLVTMLCHDSDIIDAKTVFRLSAFGVGKKRPRTTVDGDLVNQQYVTQHDLLRELAIHLSNKPDVPIAQRKRLIIAARGEDLPASVLNIQEPMQARIMSVSTGELFSSRWSEMKVPEVEVMVLNLKSKTYTLPYFMTEMQKLKILNVTNYGLYPSYIDNFLLIGSLSNLSRIRLERVEIPSLDTSILALENLQKASFMMCKIGNAFATKLSNDNLKVWPKLVELEIDYCHDLVGFPDLLCSSVHLKNLSITNCNELCEISEEFGNLTNLENLSLRSCTKLEKLPESIMKLQKLSILDISDCLSLSVLPDEFGKLGGLRTIYMMGCTGICELPLSVEELAHTHVVCNEEMYDRWLEFGNVKVERVEEDRLETLMKIIRFDTHNSNVHQP